MKRLAIYLTGHGYGHMTRTMEIAREVRSLRPEWELHVRTVHEELLIEQALGFAPTSYEPVQLDIGLVQKDSLRWDPEATVERLAYYFGYEGDQLVEREAQWLRDHNVDAALLDIPPRGFDACRLAKVPAYGITNFSWDWIWADLVEEEPRLERFSRCARVAYGSCRRLFEIQMAAGLDAFPVREQVPVVARISNREPDEVRDILGLDPNRIAVTLSYGGEGLNGALQIPARLHERFQFLVTQPMEDPGEPFTHVRNADLEAADLRYCDLVRATDIVMTKPGYSITAECAANRTAVVYSDRGRFAEYPFIVDFIETYLPSAFLAGDDLRAGRWEEALTGLADRMPFQFTDVRVDGARHVARRLAEEVEG
ncbi:hypothetical protein GF324_10085 [bacterium]|nr:hypothetical protein [bacterium]